jgi:hypothetical protein
VQKIKSDVDIRQQHRREDDDEPGSDISHGKPKFSFPRPRALNDGGRFSDPANYFHEWTMEHTENSTGDELAYRVDADIKLDAGWIDSLRIGVQCRAEREQNINWSTYNWGSVQRCGVSSRWAFFIAGSLAGTTEP